MLDEAPSFASVARKIGDCRLENVLQQLASQVEIEIRNAEFVPLRAEVRSDVKQLKAETKRFENALNRVSRRSFMQLPVSKLEYLSQARQTIDDITALCDVTLSIHSSKGGVRKKPGRVTCAMIVVEGWAFVRGDPPGGNNRDVQEICDDYWRACGYETIGQGDPGNWRRTVTEALSNQGAMRRYIRYEIRRTG
jgi:hypothetical protein